MTVKTLSGPAAFALALFLWAVILERLLPSRWETSLHLFTGFAFVTLLIRDIGLHHASMRRLERKFDDALEVVRLANESRSKEFSDARHRIAEISAQLKARNIEVDAALSGQTATIVAKIDEGTAASKNAAEVANHSNKKIEDLNQRLVDGLLPRAQAQADRIEQTTEETLAAVEAVAGLTIAATERK